MLRALTSGKDEQAEALIQVLALADADVLVLAGLDYDHGQAGLGALRERLEQAGVRYSYTVTKAPVSGSPSGVDVDGDGRLGEPEDALGYGWFSGDSGMAILSKHPLGEIDDLGAQLWRDAPDSAAPLVLSEEAAAVIPLASVAMWRVPVRWNQAELDLLTFVGSPPVFDGPEDRNGLRNRDQLRFWLRYLDANQAALPVLAGRFNVDPFDGEGHHEVLKSLLTHPTLQDPRPESDGGMLAKNPESHRGDPRFDTTAWSGTPGPLRVDYILPASRLKVRASGVLWPTPNDAHAGIVTAAGPNRLVWVELAH